MTGESGSTPYRVLARKYRPAKFGELIGQEVVVRTLTNAIASGRLAHAFILTGVRGVGKTTTARIIARALNCTGPDGDGGPTAEPCGVCEHCVAISEDRHIDVLEMDAASRTGVDDIRELIDGVLYRPVTARYKVYIIDEVHMLSKNAFNALLKTLEEPPAHVTFVFATTEIRKVPVTVLSRCQRFDLRRVESAVLATHFAGIAATEEIVISTDALGLIARVADGSVRDGLSLLDQVIAHANAAAIEETQVRDILGLVDRGRVFDLLDALMKGDVPEALSIGQEMYESGADPLAILQDLLELAHWLTRLKAVPDNANLAVSDVERSRGRAMADGLAMPVLTGAWQILLKGLNEVQMAPSAMQAAEMVLVRLAYAARLPAPADIIESLRSARGFDAPPQVPASPTPQASEPTAPPPAQPIAKIEPDGPSDIEPGDPEPGDIEPADVQPGDPEPGDPEPGGETSDADRAGDHKTIDHPLVQAALETFPGATVESVREVRTTVLFDAEPAEPDPDNNGDETS